MTKQNHALDAHQVTGRRPRGLRKYWQLVPIAVAFWGLDGLEKLRTGARAIGLVHGMTAERISDGLIGQVAVQVNHWTSTHMFLGVPAAVYYLASQLVVTTVVAILLLRSGCPSFRLHRNALVIAQAIGLVVAWVYPVAPPRLLPGHFDTVAAYLPFFAHQVAGHTADQYASFPSLHVAWAIWVAIVLRLLLRRRAWRLAAWGYPLLTTVDVLATANHYIVDVLASPALLGLAYALSYAVTAASPALSRAVPRRYQDAALPSPLIIAPAENDEAA